MSLKIYVNYNVMTKNKEVNFNMRVREDVREEFKIVAHIKGVSSSSLISQYMAECIETLKEKNPAKFEEHRLLLQEEEEKAKVNKPQTIKAVAPVGEMLNFSGKSPSRKRKSNEDAINELIDIKIAELKAEKKLQKDK